MLSVNMDDVMQVVSNIQNYLIAFGVVVVVALVAMFAAKKLPKAKKKMVRAQSGVAILLALVIVVNLICIGPMSTMHTNNAVGTLNRIADMGIERYLVADSMIGVIAQRLVRKLCPHCRKKRLATVEEKRLLRVAVYDQSGCVMLRFENYCAQPVELGADGLPRHNTHGGYDLRGVQAAAQYHDGTMTLHWADGWFTLRILLPVPS